jgi:hypothetical protein
MLHVHCFTAMTRELVAECKGRTDANDAYRGWAFSMSTDSTSEHLRIAQHSQRLHPHAACGSCAVIMSTDGSAQDEGQKKPGPEPNEVSTRKLIPAMGRDGCFDSVMACA